MPYVRYNKNLLHYKTTNVSIVDLLKHYRLTHVYPISEIPVCNPNPCRHGGKCKETSDIDFECNCTGTLYHGRTCEFGLVRIDAPRTVRRFINFDIVIKAQPQNQLTIETESVASAGGIPILPITNSRVELDNTTNTAHVTFLPISTGIQYLEVSLSGPDAATFTSVDRITILVKGTESSSYFSTFGENSLIKQSCCGSLFTLSCRNASKITFSSSCNWVNGSGSHTTHGIVFSSNNNTHLPVSVAGLHIELTQNSPTGLEVPEYNPDSCIEDNCELLELNQLTPEQHAQQSTCYKYQSNSADLESFAMKQSLAKTFLSVVRDKLFPEWIDYHIPDDALMNIAISDYTVSITNDEDVPLLADCQSVIVDTSGYFSVLHHNGPLTLPLKTSLSGKPEHISIPSPPTGSFVCIAVNLCLGDASPVYIGLPSSVQSSLPEDISFISDYISRGWSFQFLSGKINKRSSSHQLASVNYWNGSFANYHPIIPASDIELNVRIAGPLTYNTSTAYLQFMGQLLYDYEVSLSGVGKSYCYPMY